MCRNITILRGIDPPATHEEIRDAAQQFIRKVAGLSTSAQLERDDVRVAIEGIAGCVEALFASLPPRRGTAAGPPARWRQG